MPPPTVTDEEHLVREIRGIPAEHWPDLLQIIREFRVRVLGEDATLPDPAESFRRGWHEAMTQEGRPIDELWEELKAQGF